MLITFLLLVVGIVLLVGGADRLVESVSSLARRVGVPPLVIGMTVVAFGTSTPEVVVNLTAALNGSTDLSFGSIVGSCLLNLGVVIGITALYRPITIESCVVMREIPMVLLAAAAILVLTFDSLDGEVNRLDRTNGMMLLLLFCVFLYYTFMDIWRRRHKDDLSREMRVHTTEPMPTRPVWVDGLILVVSLVAVAGGGRIVVASGVAIAESLGVSPVIIGLTLLSVGTTLPELTTSLLAAKRGHADLAIGNALGSCLFNVLFVGGLTASVRSIELPPGGRGDILMFLALAAVLLPMTIFDRREQRIGRIDGAILLVGYLAYATYRSLTALM
jgi:cation:H+ antiporter